MSIKVNAMRQSVAVTEVVEYGGILFFATCRRNIFTEHLWGYAILSGEKNFSLGDRKKFLEVGIFSTRRKKKFRVEAKKKKKANNIYSIDNHLIIISSMTVHNPS